MRPERPLPEIQEKATPTLKNNQVETEWEKKNKRIEDPDSRARRRTIDMTKWGSTHLKGMFLDMPALGMKRLKLDDLTIESESGEESESDNDTLKVFQPSEQNAFSQMPLLHSVASPPTNSDNISANAQLSAGQARALPDNNTDLEIEKTQSLNLLASLFGDRDDNWVRPESPGSDIDTDGLMKGDAMLVDDNDDGIEVVPIDNFDDGMTRMEELRNEDGKNKNPEIREQEDAQVMSTKSTEPRAHASTKLKDLFAPREEEGNALFGATVIDKDAKYPLSLE